jgi:two-component system, NtrC family, sensor kinase
MVNLYRSRYSIFLFLFFVLFFFHENTKAQGVINLTESTLSKSLGTQIDFFIDTTSAYNESTILNCKSFKKSKLSVPVLLFPKYTIWARFTLSNSLEDSTFFLGLNYSYISQLWLYKIDSNNRLTLINYTGNIKAFDSRLVNDVNFTFPFKILPFEKQTYYFKVISKHPIELPISVSDNKGENASSFQQHFIVGVYLGIIVSILLYNLFLSFSTRDRSYLVYCVYLFFLGFAQITYGGWSFQYIWPSFPAINLYAVIVTSALAGISGIIFGKLFLNSSYFTPKLNKVLSGLIVIYLISIIVIFFKQTFYGYLILDINGSLVGIFLLITSIIIIKKGYRPAYFYLFAWSFFLLGLIIFTLRNVGIIPTNDFTRSLLYLGSAIEVILLSVALADRINILKKEKEQSQGEALQRARENEQLVSEQNVMLEKKVASRTSELQTANVQLSDALNNLKDTQTQLVEAEKMASLGQLTAGIAHEINNPINFVKSNINPLRLDVKDLMEVLNAYDELHTVTDHNAYKERLNAIEELKEDMDVPFIRQEIDSLIIGIEEGAERTAEIVRGLRTFSRIDEASLKTVNIHDGILSTIVLLKNNIPFNIKLIKEFKGNSEVECFPGKLNQVFMNIITNAIQAIKSKPEKTGDESIIIKTRDIEDNQIEISIKDTGPGMTEDVKHRIFEPFFTTKDVGEGTGLGMAIVFKIIQKHAGKINIITAPNEGAEFIITLPHKYQGVE